MSSYRNYIFVAIGLVLAYMMLRVLLFVLFKGYAPFLGRKRVMALDLFKELQKEKIKTDPIIFSLGAGQFGFLYQATKVWPNAKLIGVARHWPTYLMSLLQAVFRRTFWRGQIKILRSRNFYKLNMAEADVVVFYQGFDILKELAKKLKFECKSGTIMLSGQAAIPDLAEKRSFFIAEPPKRHWLKRKVSTEPATPGKGKGWEIYFLYEI